MPGMPASIVRRSASLIWAEVRTFTYRIVSPGHGRTLRGADVHRCAPLRDEFRHPSNQADTHAKPVWITRRPSRAQREWRYWKLSTSMRLLPALSITEYNSDFRSGDNAMPHQHRFPSVRSVVLFAVA